MQDIKNDKQKNTKEQEVENEPGLFNAGSASAGPMLRAARKDKSMSIEDVSEELNLSHNVVDAIENDSWEHLPEATYVRGYIRSYARLLGLDPADVLMSFRYNNSEQNISLDSMPRRIEDRKISVSVPRKVKVFLFLAAIAGVAVYLYNDQAMNLLESKIDQVAEQGASNDNQTETNNSAASNVETTTEATNSNAMVPPESAQIVTTSSDVVVSEESKELLELEFNSTSWVDIRDKEGKKIVYKSFPPGDKTSVNATLPIHVFIGNADAVAMRYQGQAIDLQQYKEEVYAKFTLGE